MQRTPRWTRVQPGAVANLIEMDRSYYASIEVGRRNVSLSNLCKIANGFNMSIAALMTGVTEKTD